MKKLKFRITFIITVSQTRKKKSILRILILVFIQKHSKNIFIVLIVYLQFEKTVKT